MQIGDLVIDRDFRWETNPRIGVILESGQCPLSMNFNVYKILWRDGSIGNNIASYDLVPVHEDRKVVRNVEK